MAVKYKVVSKRPGGIAGERSPKYYPAVTKRGLIDARELAYLLSEANAFSRPTVIGVIESFIHMIPTLLQRGNNVKLDGFGTFSLHVSGEGKDDPDEVSSRDITHVKMSFLPDKKIKEQLSHTKFEKVE
ncbi:MAG: HU family DNA-binding protein [Bacteroidota bacterium]